MLRSTNRLVQLFQLGYTAFDNNYNISYHLILEYIITYHYSVTHNK